LRAGEKEEPLLAQEKRVLAAPREQALAAREALVAPVVERERARVAQQRLSQAARLWRVDPPARSTVRHPRLAGQMVSKAAMSQTDRRQPAILVCKK
jgi:hypothetical protein